MGAMVFPRGERFLSHQTGGGNFVFLQTGGEIFFHQAGGGNFVFLQTGGEIFSKGPEDNFFRKAIKDNEDLVSGGSRI